MKYEISEFEKRVDSKYIRKSVRDDLVIYNYTEQCTHEKAWDEYTRAARGIILNRHTGEVVAKSFPKFFNLGEMPETYIDNLPYEGYTVSEKVDGSLGIIYHYNGKWNVATKGSFGSEQAIKAEELLKKYNLSNVPLNITILVEIIYPENRIVVNYKGAEKLVLIGLYNRETGNEIDLPEDSFFEWDTKLELRKSYDYTIEEMIELQKTIPKDEEGFVVRFDSGLRAKIKGAEYLKIHKIISNLSPLSFWEVMDNGKVPINYLQQVPEEFISIFEPIVKHLEEAYIRVKKEVEEDFEFLPTKLDTPEAKREIGIYLDKYTVTHKTAMFPMLLKKDKVVESYIMKQIRPKGNNLL